MKEVCQLPLIKGPLEFLFQLTLVREGLTLFQPVLRRGLYTSWAAVGVERVSVLSYNGTHFFSSVGAVLLSTVLSSCWKNFPCNVGGLNPGRASEGVCWSGAGGDPPLA